MDRFFRKDREYTINLYRREEKPVTSGQENRREIRKRERSNKNKKS